MKILAIETSGKTFSIALSEENKIIASFYCDYGHIHSEMLIPSIERLLKDTKTSFESIDKFAVSVGPGSFTGIRIGMTATKIFAQLLNKPIFTIDTLSILEKPFIGIKGVKVVAAIDALRNEVYIKHKNIIIIKNINLFIKDLKKYKNKVLIVGTAATVYKELIIAKLGEYTVSLPDITHSPKAEHLATLAYQSTKSTNYIKAHPLYIRRLCVEETIKIKN
ncbi:MAG: tRNA (adenosine(37)-N6)-threonylcarbamoyltransferase complex dimerization subunit type 1 TsaB [Endomicrobium sp.]|jgi:tRNA threonylcarbamoyladenosine biosynthesis protein TsaB|nr:tRNA (adenosine(37)-N6)-threonylcarbamoyltransferase complex dimerization subunit type 1 TsaB [Endomicrobium sp.]